MKNPSSYSLTDERDKRSVPDSSYGCIHQPATAEERDEREMGREMEVSLAAIVPSVARVIETVSEAIDCLVVRAKIPTSWRHGARLCRYLGAKM